MIKKTENFMNNFTAETRRQLKREQKARVMENLGRCIGIQLMYLVPYVLPVRFRVRQSVRAHRRRCFCE